jgi:hypothetical protein
VNNEKGSPMNNDVRPQDLCYDGAEGRVFVDELGAGWTERESAERLRELQPIDPVIAFNWGYIGSGSNQVAQAILRDALGVDEPPQFLYQGFTADFVSQFPDEFRIRQGAVLRWVRGLLCGMDRHDFPVLPPVDPYDEAYRLR